MLQRFKNWLKTRSKIWWIGGALLLLIIIIAIAASRGGEGNEEVSVERRTITDEVSVSGTVEARVVSDLGFETGGVVRTISVAENQKVAQGQLLASLGLGTLGAELQSAQAAVAIKEAEQSNTGINLTAIKEKQDILVKNARIALFSEGLVAEPQSSTYVQEAPIISGRYAGAPGTYKVTIRPGTQSNQSDLYVFDMEDIEPVEINKTGPTALGTQGLFISFPADPGSYEDTTWYVTIPNTKSDRYAENYSAYQSALAERDRALSEAQAELRSEQEGGSIASAELAQARAEVARIQALIGERTLRAPFNGVVTEVTVDPGESVTVGAPAISLISDDGFGVEVDLPEIDSIKVKRGDHASITLDAFGDTTFTGTVVSVNRTETTVDGVSVYESRIAFDAPDERIASGMTATVSIVTDEKHDVLALPARAIRRDDKGVSSVVVKNADGKEQETEIVEGLRGSDGSIEVRSGLTEGTVVVVPAQ